jgi:hypothetical protein
MPVPEGSGKYKPETVVFNGIKFRRYPDSPRLADSRYYRPSASHIKRGVQALHCEVWKHYHGPIPEGFHVHHKDENPCNNDVANLECLPGFDHLSLHASKSAARQRAREWVDAIRPLASAWHKSEEGRAWHREHAKRIGFAQYRHEGPSFTIGKHICEQCGEEYEAADVWQNRFCSNKCKSAYRRASGVDNEERICPICGKTFTANKYARTRTCSSSCGFRSRSG